MECKSDSPKEGVIVRGELIDTLWNVNLSDKSTLAVRSTRINRYIMECKCKTDYLRCIKWRQN